MVLWCAPQLILVFAWMSSPLKAFLRSAYLNTSHLLLPDWFVFIALVTLPDILVYGLFDNGVFIMVDGKFYEGRGFLFSCLPLSSPALCKFWAQNRCSLIICWINEYIVQKGSFTWGTWSLGSLMFTYLAELELEYWALYYISVLSLSTYSIISF